MSCARLTLGVLLLSSLAILTCPLEVYSQEATEQEIKAAMLYKFLSYTSWPEEAFAAEDAPYRIWLLQAGLVAKELEQIAQVRRVNDRPIEVFTATRPEEIGNPHVIFIGRDANLYRTQIEHLAEMHSALVVTESPRGLTPGSVINLRVVDGRIGFDVSLEYAQRSNLEISSRLLSVAASVEQ